MTVRSRAVTVTDVVNGSVYTFKVAAKNGLCCDVAAANVRTEDERAADRDAVQMITMKLWPELGDLLDGDDEAWP